MFVFVIFLAFFLFLRGSEIGRGSKEQARKRKKSTWIVHSFFFRHYSSLPFGRWNLNLWHLLYTEEESKQICGRGSGSNINGLSTYIFRYIYRDIRSYFSRFSLRVRSIRLSVRRSLRFQFGFSWPKPRFGSSFVAGTLLMSVTVLSVLPAGVCCCMNVAAVAAYMLLPWMLLLLLAGS